jgi:hypothetical protein
MSVPAHLTPWFGLRPPETAAFAWGARAIVGWGGSPYGGRADLDLVWNRQQCSHPHPQTGAHAELHAELDGYFLPLLRQRMASGDRALIAGSSTEVTEIKSGRVTLRACPNGSHGYLYICAYVEREDLTPEELADADRR